MSGSVGLRLLYHTAPGRLLLRLAVRPSLSRLVGRLLDRPVSRRLIGPFQRKTGITLEGIDVPEGGFASFNDFFSRRRLSVDFDPVPEHLCSPCDGHLSAFPIEADSVFSVKHTRYSVAELLDDKALARRFEGGLALIFRLMPADYHRYSCVDGGEIRLHREIGGVLHCVRPIATETYPVYVQNSRAYVLLDSDAFGPLVQMEVGALLVGRIVNHRTAGRVARGEEKGYFAYGGSTIVLLFERGRVRLREEVRAALAEQEEIPVRQGEYLAFSAGM